MDATAPMLLSDNDWPANLATPGLTRYPDSRTRVHVWDRRYGCAL